MYKLVFQKREVMVFRQFQRKGYSLFACLGREVLISVLSVATLSSAKADGISDETWRADSAGQVREVWLGDVGVTGSRAPMTKSQAARMVTVLSREDIAQAPVQSVNDLLKYAVGVDVRQRGALGSQTDISIRGGTQEQIAVLLNGINICDPQTAHNVLELPVQLSEIVRIEVLEGPAGRVYGTSSLVGAINIVTERSRGAEPQDGESPGHSSELNVEAGSFGYAKAAFVTRLSAVNSHSVTHSFSGSYARSDGYSRCTEGTLNTDYSGSKAYYQGAYDDSNVHIGWHVGMADKGWGSGAFYATPRWQADDQYEHTTKILAAVQGDTRQGVVHIQPAMYWQQHYDRYEGYRNRPDVMRYNYNRCNVYGLKTDGWFDSPLGRTVLGAELRFESLMSSNLGEPLMRSHHIHGTDRFYTLGIDRTNISAHLEHNIMLERLTLSAGFVAAKSSVSTMNITVYPGIDVSYRILGDASSMTMVKVFAGWNSSLRLPSFTEMYYKLQGYAADPHLKPEEMRALEVGAQMSSPVVQAKTTVWHHHGTNMIDWIMDTSLGDDAVWQSVNHTKINSFGIEAEIDIANTFNVSYSYINQDKKTEPNIVSQYAMEYLHHKLVATLYGRLWKSLDISLNVRWQDRVGSYTTFAGDVCDYRPYALADARLQWNARRYSIYGKVNNILDNRSYVDFGNVPQPGLWFVIGATLRLSK